MADSHYNVIWIFGDQHPAHLLGCNGSANVSTPHIDRLSAEGVNFERAVSGCPVCCPFRGSLLTSRYPHECVPDNHVRMPPELPTIASAFREHDYHTAWFGKWHLDGHKNVEHFVPPERRGHFDTWIGYENNNAQWATWVHGTGLDEPMRLPKYETDSLTDLFIEHLETRAETPAAPFFAALSVQPPHTPYVAPGEWMRRHKPADVDLRPNVPRIPSIEPTARRDLAGASAMVENLDWNVGRIIETLERTGLADNTFIVFFSDHGDMHGSHGQWRKLVPWEESIRIPFIIGGAGRLGSRYGCNTARLPHLVNHVDIAPTTLGLCGIETPDWMRGCDYSGHVVKGKQPGDYPDSAYIQSTSGPTVGKNAWSWRAVVTEDNWKYAVIEGQPWQLFDLNDDPYELSNQALCPKYWRQRERLQAKLKEWMEKTGDDFPLPDLQR